MSTTGDALAQLLARAIELEGKAADAGVEVTPAAVTESQAVVELQAKIAELEGLVDELTAGDGTPDPDILAELAAAGLVPADAAPAAELEDDGLQGWVDDWAEQQEEPVGADFDELADDPALELAGKAAGWAPCPDCGSTNVDEFADGTARCEDCGTLLSSAGPEQAKGYDFDDLEGVDEPVEAKADDEVEAEPEAAVETKADTISEFELLLARRAQLDA